MAAESAEVLKKHTLDSDEEDNLVPDEKLDEDDIEGTFVCRCRVLVSLDLFFQKPCLYNRYSSAFVACCCPSMILSNFLQVKRRRP